MTRNNKFGSADARDQVAARDLLRAYDPRGSSGSAAMRPLQAGQQVWRIRALYKVGRNLGIDGCLQRRRHRQWRSRGS